MPAASGTALYIARLNAELARHLDGIQYLYLQDQIDDRQVAEMVDRAFQVHDSLLLSAEHPCFRVWREDICGRVRYVAVAQHAGVRPHTVVTADVGELRAALLDLPL